MNAADMDEEEGETGEGRPTIDLQRNEKFEDSHPFSPEQVGIVCRDALMSWRDHGKKGFKTRDDEFYKVRGKNGKRVVAVLKTCIKINDSNNRKNVKGEAITMTMLVRMLMYRYANAFTKEKYNNEVGTTIRWLSDRLVIKVGSDWENIPERAFGCYQNARALLMAVSRSNSMQKKVVVVCMIAWTRSNVPCIQLDHLCPIGFNAMTKALLLMKTLIQ